MPHQKNLILRKRNSFGVSLLRYALRTFKVWNYTEIVQASE